MKSPILNFGLKNLVSSGYPSSFWGFVSAAGLPFSLAPPVYHVHVAWRNVRRETHSDVDDTTTCHRRRRCCCCCCCHVASSFYVAPAVAMIVAVEVAVEMVLRLHYSRSDIVATITNPSTDELLLHCSIPKMAAALLAIDSPEGRMPPHSVDYEGLEISQQRRCHIAGQWVQGTPLGRITLQQEGLGCWCRRW